MASAITLAGDKTIHAPIGRGLSEWQLWGIILMVHYILVFALFVIYPVGYGLWTARHPRSYYQLFEDPIFARSAVNTLIFLVIGVNLKMVVALALSGFFI